jgi:hypothetical protein
MDSLFNAVTSILKMLGADNPILLITFMAFSIVAFALYVLLYAIKTLNKKDQK